MYRRKNMAEIISGVYKITNTVTGDSYIGSSKDVKRRWASHKWPSMWNKQPNNPMYLDMQEYGVDKFEFQILAEVEPEQLKEAEQQFIEKLKPTYNNYNANGLNIERYKEYHREYHKTDKYKEYQKEYQKSDKYKEYMKEYKQSDKYKEYEKSEKRKKYKKEYMKEYNKEYQQSDKYKEYQKEFYKEYNNQLCSYNGELLTLCALSKRFQKAGIAHPTIEAKKYLVL